MIGEISFKCLIFWQYCILTPSQMFDWILNMPLLPVKNKGKIILYEKLKNLRPLFMDGVQLAQAYRATPRRQFTFYHSVPRSSWYSFDQPQNDKKAELTFELPNGFELGTPVLGIQHTNHYDNWEDIC